MRAILLSAILLGGCATTPAGLAKTNVERTVTSEKSSANFATCAAEHFNGDVTLRSSGDHYWILISIHDYPRYRWDFRPSGAGSIAEGRSTGLTGGGTPKAIKRCA